MTRQHIHLALALPPARSVASTSADASAAEHEPAQDAGKVVSGIRPSADLYIYLDVPLLLSGAFRTPWLPHRLSTAC